MRRLVFGAILAAVTLGATAADQAVLDRYNKSCVVCHAGGVAGAPKTGVPADWKPRLSKGVDTLVASTRNGLKMMPPRGMCNDCSDADYKALIQYMTTAK